MLTDGEFKNKKKRSAPLLHAPPSVIKLGEHREFVYPGLGRTQQYYRDPHDHDRCTAVISPEVSISLPVDVCRRLDLLSEYYLPLSLPFSLSLSLSLSPGVCLCVRRGLSCA